MVKLGDVLTQRKEKIFVEDPLQAKLISVRLYGKGALQREIGDGKVPKAFTGYIGHTGQLVLSRIWARKGAIALIPHDLEGVVVTNEFPLFDVDETQVIPKYLIQLLTSNNFGPTLERASSGSSGQNRVRENKFLEISISLPPLEEQKRIVSILDKAKSIQKAREHQLAALDELASSIFEEEIACKEWNTVSLSSIVSKLGSGSTPKGGSAAYKNVGTSLIRSMNIHDGRFKADGLAFIDDEQAEKLKGVTVEPDDVLINITGASVTRVTRAPKEYLPARVNQHVCIIRPIPETIHPVILENYLLNSKIKNKLLKLAKAGATREAISKTKLANFPVPLVDQESQDSYLNKVNNIYIKKSLISDSLEMEKQLSLSLKTYFFSYKGYK